MKRVSKTRFGENGAANMWKLDMFSGQLFLPAIFVAVSIILAPRSTPHEQHDDEQKVHREPSLENAPRENRAANMWKLYMFPGRISLGVLRGCCTRNSLLEVILKSSMTKIGLQRNVSIDVGPICVPCPCSPARAAKYTQERTKAPVQPTNRNPSMVPAFAWAEQGARTNARTRTRQQDGTYQIGNIVPEARTQYQCNSAAQDAPCGATSRRPRPLAVPSADREAAMHG